MESLEILIPSVIILFSYVIIFVQALWKLMQYACMQFPVILSFIGFSRRTSAYQTMNAWITI